MNVIRCGVNEQPILYINVIVANILIMVTMVICNFFDHAPTNKKRQFHKILDISDVFVSVIATQCISPTFQL